MRPKVFDVSAAVLSVTLLFQVGTAGAGNPVEKGESMQTQHETKARDIVTTALEAGSFKTLAAALEAAGLVETLQSKGPFTVFAPTDAAFAKLPKGTLEELLKPENKGRLTAILTYHVVPGLVAAKDVATMKSAKTVNGLSLSIKVDKGAVTIDDATVVKADIGCSNGIIHVIDSVVLPK
jgi:uncharacterized surface protein with fasciclin (FAS1) repeats